jgi:hypothetical protein
VGFSFERLLTSRHFNWLLDEISDHQVLLILTGDCWSLLGTCICRSFERFDLHRLGVTDVHGRLTGLGLRVQAALIEDQKF